MLEQIRSCVYNLKQGVANIIRWRKVIWQDRDWDYEFIYILLHKKLEHMEGLFRDDGASFTTNSTKRAEEVKEVKDALNRLIKDEYLETELKVYRSIYGEDDELWKIGEKDERGFRKLEWTEDSRQLLMFEQACDRADKKQAEDRELVFNNMRDQIEGWWD